MESRDASKNGRSEERPKSHEKARLVRLGLSKSFGEANTNCEKSTTASPGRINVRRMSYSGFSAPVAPTTARRRSCLLPPNSIRDQYIRKQAKDTIAEEPPTALSPKIQTIRKFQNKSALMEQPKVEVKKNLEIHEIATLVEAEHPPGVSRATDSVVAASTQEMKGVIEVDTKIPRSSAITSFVVSTVIKTGPLSFKPQTTKFEKNSAFKKTPEVEIENVPEIHKIASFPTVGAPAQEMKQVFQVDTEIPGHSVVTGLTTSAVQKNQRLSSKCQTIRKLKRNPPPSKNKRDVEVKNAPEIHEIGTLHTIERSAQQTQQVFQVDTEIPRHPVIMGLVTSTALKSRSQSANSEDSGKSEYALSRPPLQALKKNSSMPLRRLDATSTSLEDLLGDSAVSRRDQRSLRWLRRNLIFTIESTEKTLFSLKQMLKVVEDTMGNNTFDSMGEKSLESITENYFHGNLPKILIKDAKDVAAREKKFFAVKTETNCDENLTEDLRRNKENVPTIGDKLENEERNESVEKSQRRPEAAALSKNRDDNFLSTKTAVRKWLRLS